MSITTFDPTDEPRAVYVLGSIARVLGISPDRHFTAGKIDMDSLGESMRAAATALRQACDASAASTREALERADELEGQLDEAKAEIEAMVEGRRAEEERARMRLLEQVLRASLQPHWPESPWPGLLSATRELVEEGDGSHTTADIRKALLAALDAARGDVRQRVKDTLTDYLDHYPHPEFLDAVMAHFAPPAALAVPVVDKARFESAPCYLCGYNGPGYYQPSQHPCAAGYHAQQPAAAVPAGWRVVWFTGSFKRGSERWEIYDPEGNGGAVDKGDIRDDMVWGLLDALAAAPQPQASATGEAVAYREATTPMDAMYAAFEAADNQDAPLEEYPQRAIDALAAVGYAVVPAQPRPQDVGLAKLCEALKSYESAEAKGETTYKHYEGVIRAARELLAQAPQPQASAEDVALVDALIDGIDWPYGAYERAAWQRIRASLGVGK